MSDPNFSPSHPPIAVQIIQHFCCHCQSLISQEILRGGSIVYQPGEHYPEIHQKTHNQICSVCLDNLTSLHRENNRLKSMLEQINAQIQALFESLVCESLV